MPRSKKQHDDARIVADVQKIADFLRAWRYNFGTEKELQDGIWKLVQTEWPGPPGWHRERSLADKGRIDFYHEPTGIGVEAKIDHSLSALTRQLHGYVQHDSIYGLILITPKLRLSALPERINGKPVRVVSLIGSVL